MPKKTFFAQQWLLPAFLFALIVLLTACNETAQVNAAPAVTPSKALTVISVPTATPTTSTQLILVPTNTPVEPPTPEPTAPAQPVAWVRFSDPQPAPADQANGAFVLQASTLPTPPAGNHYELWLSQNQQPLFRVGALATQLPLTLTNSTGQPWLAGYAGVILSLAPDGQEAPQMGSPVLQGALPAAILAPLRQVVSTVAENPDQQSFLRGAQAQLALAQEHAEMLRTALAAGNLTDGRRHAEHVINILNGKTSKQFGDFDGDGVVQNPGDGVGVVGYLNGANAALKQVATVPVTNAAMRQQAADVLVCTNNGLAWLTQATETALRIIAADSASEAQSAAAALIQVLAQMSDSGGNAGAGKPVPGECGLRVAYATALDLSSIALYPVKPAASVPITGTLTAAHDHTATQTVVIEMHDFAFSEPVVIIHTGATITWINHGQAKHSATADNGSFDTGLLLPGGSASVTFAKPGVYPYYCVLHGGSGGQGMAARVIVQG